MPYPPIPGLAEASVVELGSTPPSPRVEGSKVWRWWD